jgi:hypothetical protein
MTEKNWGCINCSGWDCACDKPKTVELTPERYQELLDAEDKLIKLEAGGVDNWDGYEFCFEEE